MNWLDRKIYGAIVKRAINKMEEFHMLNVMLKNKWTTITGFALGVLFYFQQQGANFPTTGDGWIDFLTAALLAGLGYVSKDAVTGSKPGGVK